MGLVLILICVMKKMATQFTLYVQVNLTEKFTLTI